MSDSVNIQPPLEFGHRPRQLDLFISVQLDPTAAVKAAVREALRLCPRSREQVVDEINRLAEEAGVTVNGAAQKTSIAILDKWAAPGAAAHLIPLKLIPIFCRATGSALPLVALSGLTPGARVIGEEDYQLLEWARAERALRQNKREARKRALLAGLD